MKRKILAAFLAVITAFSMTACGSKDTGTSVSGNEAVSDESADTQNPDTGSVSEDSAGVSTDEPIEVTKSFVDYDIHECVKLGDYKNMKIELEDRYAVTEEALNSNIDLILTYVAGFEDSDKKVVESGDVANIDYVGKKDGVAFSGGTASGYDLEIGSHTFIDGFEDGLIGVKVGETVDLNLRFPDNYRSAELAGADVVFTVTVNKVKVYTQYTHETVTDSYVNQKFGYDTKEDLYDAVEAEMQEDSETSIDADTRQAVLDQLMSMSEVNVPDGLLEQKTEQWIQMFKNQVCRDTDLATYVQNNYSMTEEEFKATVTDEMSETLKQELVLEALADDMDFTVPNEELQDYFKNSVTSSGYESLDDMFYVYSNQYETAQEYLGKNYRYTQALKRLSGTVDVKIVSAEEKAEEDAEKAEDDAEKSEEDSEDDGNDDDSVITGSSEETDSTED